MNQISNDSMYVLAIDQGTSSTKSLVFDTNGSTIARGVQPLHTYYLKDGFVEQDPEEIYKNVLQSVRKCLDEFREKGGKLSRIQSCGISNQRETFVLWNREGKPLYNAIVWQCKRSVGICDRLKSQGIENEIRQKTGLILDPYFSGTKLLWLFENNSEIKTAINKSQAFFGTIDTWLLFKMTGGKCYYTDYTNASRTLFFNLHTLDWDKEILKRWGLENLNLPQIKSSAADFGVWESEHFSLPITALIGDSHAAAFGESCFERGAAKATLGTGCSVMMNIGDKPVISENGMLGTICWSINGRVDYALEGAIVSCGSTLEWLKNEMGLFADSRDTESMARVAGDNGGVYLIPAFSGLGAPHWEMNRKASISGLNFHSNKNHIVRAALESISYQIKDVISVMEKEANQTLTQLNIDGGISTNNFVMQFTADLLGIEVTKIRTGDVSALGAAYLSGLKSGTWRDLDELVSLDISKASYFPNEMIEDILSSYEGWKAALKNS